MRITQNAILALAMDRCFVQRPPAEAVQVMRIQLAEESLIAGPAFGVYAAWLPGSSCPIKVPSWGPHNSCRCLVTEHSTLAHGLTSTPIP